MKADSQGSRVFSREGLLPIHEWDQGRGQQELTEELCSEPRQGFAGKSTLPDVLQEALKQFLGRAAENTILIIRTRMELAGSRTSPQARAGNGSAAARALTHEKSAHVQSFFVLPSRKSPRWLFPLGERRTSLHALELCEPYRPASRLLKALLAGAIRAGWKGWGCDRLVLETAAPLALERLVQEVTAEKHPVFALSLGLPHRFRKLVVQAMRPGGEVLGFIKLPLSLAARERIRHEAKVLSELWECESLRPHIPQVLYAGEWEDSCLLFVSPGPTRQGGTEWRSMHEQFFRTLWGVQQSAKDGDTLVTEVARRWKKLEPLLHSEWRQLGAASLARARELLTGHTLPCGVAHGDFDPGNTRTSLGRLFVFDWETAAWDMPNSWDTFYFHLMSGKQTRPELATQFAERLNPAERGSFVLFLVNSLCESFEDGVPHNHPNVEFRKRLLVRELQ